jgi:hypothetical protein
VSQEGEIASVILSREDALAYAEAMEPAEKRLWFTRNISDGLMEIAHNPATGEYGYGLTDAGRAAALL